MAPSRDIEASGLRAQSDTSLSHPYTCNTCQVAFRNSDLQRGHMRSDWHRYNLKRRVSSLSPITSEVFREKVLAAQASSTAAAAKALYERTCRACEKTYFSENAYNNHIGSQKHRANVTILKDSVVIPEVETSSIQSASFTQEHADNIPTNLDINDGPELCEAADGIQGASLADEDGMQSAQVGPQHPVDGQDKDSRSSATDTKLDISLQRCLFCNCESPTLSLNVLHMERVHGMFIPERNYLVDLPGLIGSLHERIHEFHECLYCGKLKPTVFGLQTHMRDKGHCKIRFDTEEEQLEIGEFYDFTSTYSDFGDDSDDGKDVTKEVPNETEDADGWETDSSASSLDSADLTAVPLDQHIHQYERLDRHPHHTSQDPRPHHNRDGWHSHAHRHAHAVFYSEYELHLPSGRSVGHRSLSRYYRQNLQSHTQSIGRQEPLAIGATPSSGSGEPSQQMTLRGDNERRRLLATRATGIVGVSEQKKREVLAIEKRGRRTQERESRRFQWGNDKRGNHQKHFRDHLLQ